MKSGMHLNHTGVGTLIRPAWHSTLPATVSNNNKPKKSPLPSSLLPVTRPQKNSKYSGAAAVTE